MALMLCQIIILLRYKGQILRFMPKSQNLAQKNLFYVFPHILPYIIFVLIVWMTNAMLGVGGSGHIEILSQISVKSIVRNFIYYIFIFGDFFALPKFDFKYNYLVPQMGFIFVIFGIPLFLRGIKLQFEKATMQTIFIALFMLGSIGMLILWPPLQGIRFVFCVLPFMVFFSAMGYENIPKYKMLFCAALAWFALKDCVYITQNINNNFAYKKYDAFSKNAKGAYDFIKQRTPKDAVIAFFKPRVLYLNTNRISVYRSDDFSGCDFALAYNGDFSKQENFVEIYKNDEFILYKILR
ncbi:hypothetical protein [Helicobacter sp. 23-1045]